MHCRVRHNASCPKAPGPRATHAARALQCMSKSDISHHDGGDDDDDGDVDCGDDDEDDADCGDDDDDGEHSPALRART